MTKHTPAPWTIQAGEENGSNNNMEVATIYGIERVQTENGFGAHYCTIVRNPMTHETYKEWEQQNTANAHLIAAAPEMYEVLEDILLYCELDDERVLERVREAIAKAEGK